MEVKFVLSDAITRYARFHITTSGSVNLAYLCLRKSSISMYEFMLACLISFCNHKVCDYQFSNSLDSFGNGAFKDDKLS